MVIIKEGRVHYAWPRRFTTEKRRRLSRRLVKAVGKGVGCDMVIECPPPSSSLFLSHLPSLLPSSPCFLPLLPLTLSNFSFRQFNRFFACRLMSGVSLPFRGCEGCCVLLLTEGGAEGVDRGWNTKAWNWNNRREIAGMLMGCIQELEG